MVIVFFFVLDNFFIQVSPIETIFSPTGSYKDSFVGKNFPWNRSIHGVMFPRKNLFLIIGLRESFALIPTDTHLFNKETCLWNQWDFRTAHQRKYEDSQVGADFHIGTKYLY